MRTLEIAVKGHPELVQVERGREFTGIGLFPLLSRAKQRCPFGHCCGVFADEIDFSIARFIPNRDGQDFQATYSLLHEDGCPSTPSKTKKRTPHSELHFQKSKP